MSNQKQPKETVTFVEALQNAVQKSKGNVAAQVKEANVRILGAGSAKAKLNLKVFSEGAEKGPASLRVTCPSRSVVSVEIPKSLPAEVVEFYLTRTRVDGVAETRLLGATKYRDGDGKWSVSFTSERFSRRPDDPLVVHAEVLGEGGRLLGAQAVNVVD